MFASLPSSHKRSHLRVVCSNPCVKNFGEFWHPSKGPEIFLLREVNIVQFNFTHEHNFAKDYQF